MAKHPISSVFGHVRHRAYGVWMRESEIRDWLTEHGTPDDERYPGHLRVVDRDIPDDERDDVEAFLREHHAHWEPLDAEKADALMAETKPGHELPTITGEPWAWWFIPKLLDAPR